MIINYFFILVIVLIILFLFKNKKEYKGSKKEKIELHKSLHEDNREVFRGVRI